MIIFNIRFKTPLLCLLQSNILSLISYDEPIIHNNRAVYEFIKSIKVLFIDRREMRT